MTVTELLETVRRVRVACQPLGQLTRWSSFAYLRVILKGRGMDFVSFPHTPARTHGARGDCFQSLDKSTADFCLGALENKDMSNGCSLSPRERVRVRGNAATLVKISNPQPAIENFP